MKIISLNVGKPSDLTRGEQCVRSAMVKEPASGGVYLTKLNFAGDAQADLVNHGGPDKAICVYPFEHYSFWEKELHINLPYSAFGENLTVLGWTEKDACIGDIYQMGNAVVQVSQPRQPCFKLALRLGVEDMANRVIDTGYTGFYLRVLQEGTVSTESTITLLKQHPLQMTIAEANKIKHYAKDDTTATNKLLAIEELSENWRQSLEKRLGTPE